MHLAARFEQTMRATSKLLSNPVIRNARYRSSVRRGTTAFNEIDAVRPNKKINDIHVPIESTLMLTRSLPFWQHERRVRAWRAKKKALQGKPFSAASGAITLDRTLTRKSRDVDELFATIDADGNGVIDQEEFQFAMASVGLDQLDGLRQSLSRNELSRTRSMVFDREGTRLPASVQPVEHRVRFQRWPPLFAR